MIGINNTVGIRKPDVFYFRFSNGKKSGFQMVLTIQNPDQNARRLSLDIKWSRLVNHSKTGHVRFLDPHCTFYTLITLLIAILYVIPSTSKAAHRYGLFPM